MKIKQGQKTSSKQISGFFMPNEEYKPNNVSEQSASGERTNRKDLDKETLKKSCTKLPLNPKSKFKLSHAQSSLLPLTVFHQNVRGLRGKTNELISQLYPTYTVYLGASYEPLRITANILRQLQDRSQLLQELI